MKSMRRVLRACRGVNRQSKDIPMRKSFTALLFAAVLLVPFVTMVGANSPATTDNPAIDMEGYLKVSRDAAEHRASRRVSEEEFLRMAREPGTLVLDARSRARYDELHVKGAVHLNFSDIAYETLARMIPDKNTRILIYCNNNFANAESPFPSKMPSASLNISTYIALYNYGYRNVYELAPLIDFKQSKLPFESTPARNAVRAAG